MGILKCKITVEKKAEAEKESFIKYQEEQIKEQKEEVKKDSADKTDIVLEATTKYPFDIGREEIQDYITETKDFSVRLYLIQCQNLTAVDSYADWKSAFAGYSANCSADPYLNVQIGKGKNTDGLVRSIDDSKNLMKSTLNPRFKQTFPMNAIMPEDNAILIEVYSKKLIKDSLIGFTKFDLEDRYYGDPYNQGIIALKLYKKYYEKKLKEAKKDRKNYYKSQLMEINRIFTQLETFEHKNPIEFRQLIVADKKQSQGTCLMWLDIFPSDSRFPEYNLKAMGVNSYELRLVIWDTYEIPKTEGV